jgi:hypothetical protein
MKNSAKITALTPNLLNLNILMTNFPIKSSRWIQFNHRINTKILKIHKIGIES